ncbi:hypothetical protein EASAB2608_04854 [Streptomyces sp. EAS-AB2608]|nr:hypothetical protein EASAB2608_04854 [Streptomyces sp. EAS-AB2608]
MWNSTASPAAAPAATTASPARTPRRPVPGLPSWTTVSPTRVPSPGTPQRRSRGWSIPRPFDWQPPGARPSVAA